MNRVVLVRHAEAQKNVEDRHGGIGTALTELGRRQAKQFANDLSAYFGEVCKVITTSKPQCRETAEIICSSLNMEPEVTQRLPPYHLGILDGLSRSEAMQLFPEYAQAMNRWRRGLDEIHALDIPQSTDAGEYYQKGLEFLAYIESSSQTCIFVGTRSTLVLMWNVLRGRTPTLGGGYFERPWTNLEWVEFIRANKKEGWVEQRMQRPLEEPK